MRTIWISALITLCSCAASPPSPPPPPVPAPATPPAWDYLAALAEIGPRVPGTPGGERAGELIRSRLEELGIEVLEDRALVEDRGDGEPLQVSNVVGVLPADSPDLFVLAARYDTPGFESFPFVGANLASGAALLLELAQRLREEPLPYTVWLAFLGADSPQGEIAPSRALWGSQLLVQRLRDLDQLERVRLVVYFDRVGDADLSISRDLRSHRLYRDAFFRAAERLQHAEAFPMDAGFDSVSSGHLVFWRAGVRRVIVLADVRYGGGERPGVYHHTEEDTLAHCSPASLDVVADVGEQGLRDLAALLTRVDRFVRRRPAEESEAAEPGGPPAPVDAEETLDASPGVAPPAAEAAAGSSAPGSASDVVPPSAGGSLEEPGVSEGGEGEAR